METRKSMKRPLYFTRKRPSCGTRPLGNVQIAEHFDARKDGGMPFLGDGLHGVLQYAVDAVLYGHFGVRGLQCEYRWRDARAR